MHALCRLYRIRTLLTAVYQCTADRTLDQLIKTGSHAKQTQYNCNIVYIWREALTMFYPLERKFLSDSGQDERK